MTEKEKPPFIPPKQDTGSDSESVKFDKAPPVKVKKRVQKKTSKTSHKSKKPINFMSRTELRATVHKQRDKSKEDIHQMSLTEAAEEKKKKKNSKTKLQNRRKSSSSLTSNDAHDKENDKEKGTETDKENTTTKPRKKSSKLAIKEKVKTKDKDGPPLFMRHSAERAEIRKNRLRAASKEVEEVEAEEEEEAAKQAEPKKTSKTKLRKKSSLLKANGAPNFMRHSALRAEMRKERLAKKAEEEAENEKSPPGKTTSLQLLTKMVKKSNEFLRSKSDTDAPRRTKSNSNEETTTPIVVKKRKSLVKVRRKSSQPENQDFNINSVDLKRNPKNSTSEKKKKRNSSTTDKNDLPVHIKKVKSVVIDDNPTFNEDETSNSYGTNSGSEPDSVEKPLVSIMKKTHQHVNHEKHKQSLEETQKGKKLSTKKKEELKIGVKNEKQINDSNKKSKKNSTSYKNVFFSFLHFSEHGDLSMEYKI